MDVPVTVFPWENGEFKYWQTLAVELILFIKTARWCHLVAGLWHWSTKQNFSISLAAIWPGFLNRKGLKLPVSVYWASCELFVMSRCLSFVYWFLLAVKEANYQMNPLTLILPCCSSWLREICCFRSCRLVWNIWVTILQGCNMGVGVKCSALTLNQSWKDSSTGSLSNNVFPRYVWAHCLSHGIFSLCASQRYRLQPQRLESSQTPVTNLMTLDLTWASH